MKPDLSNCSLIELREIIAEASALITVKEREEKHALLEKFKADAQAAGFSLGEVMEAGAAEKPAKGTGGRKASGGSVPPKYRNPDNRLETWSGRGRQPVWFRERIEAGQSAESMLIGDDGVMLSE